MAGSNSDADKQRRDLYAISVGIILYNLAGGHVKPESTTLFGAISLTRPEVLLWGAAVLWVYFLWRFRLATKGALARFQLDVDEEIYKSKKYANFTQRRLLSAKAYAEKEMKTLSSSDPQYPIRSGILTRQIVELNAVAAQRVVFAFDPKTWFSSFMNFYVLDVNKQPKLNIQDLGRNAIATTEADAPWSGYLKWRILGGAILRASGVQETFSDCFLPYVVAICAPLTVAARVAWHWTR